MKIAIVGATGAVGVEMVRCLEQSRIVVSELRLLASSRSAGKIMRFDDSDVPVTELKSDSFKDINIALFSAGSEISKKYASYVIDDGATMIDNSSAFRMYDKVPLIIPEINPEIARRHKGIIANPNCSTIISAVPLWPLHKKYPIKRIIASTYQAASGAGWEAMEELKNSTRAMLDGQPFEYSIMPHPYAFNLFSHNSAIDPLTLYNEEELKLSNETRKIFNDNNLRISATCVRVPVLRAHTIALTVEFMHPVNLREVNDVLSNAQGVTVVDDPVLNYFPMPSDASGKNDVLVGRIRMDISDSSRCTICMLIAGDQLLKGAALNAVQIAELFV